MSGSRRTIEGLYPVAPTPFRDGRVDPQACAAIVDFLAPHVDGITLLASMGEGPSMSVAQRQAACEAFMQAASGRIGVMLGVGANAVSDTLALASHGAAQGVDALFLPAPAYYDASLAGILDFLKALGGATDVPIALYDNPYTTGKELTPAFMASLEAAAPSFRYVKVTDRRCGKVSEIRRTCGLVPLAGSDEVQHRQVLEGARGVCTGVAMAAPKASRRWWDACERGDIDIATSIFAGELSLVAIEMISNGDEYPAIAKECLRLLGVTDLTEVLPPLQCFPAGRTAELARMLRVAGEEVIDASP